MHTNNKLGSMSHQFYEISGSPWHHGNSLFLIKVQIYTFFFFFNVSEGSAIQQRTEVACLKSVQYNRMHFFQMCQTLNVSYLWMSSEKKKNQIHKYIYTWTAQPWTDKLIKNSTDFMSHTITLQNALIFTVVFC